MDIRKDTRFEAILEQLIEHGADDMANFFARMFELVIRIEREYFLCARQSVPKRCGYANGFKLKRIDTPACAPSARPY